VTHPSLAATLAAVARRLRDLHAAAGVVLLAGAAVAALGIVAFAWVAAHVVAGRTQAFDEAVLGALARHRVPWLQALMVDVTLLGATSVVVGIAAVAALFLAITRHRDSAMLLLASTVGAQLLNDVLKRAFDRPRPHVFDWGTQVATTSFPSGHAMSAAAVYATVAYLAARLEARRAVRVATYVAAALVILAVGFSRLYLGVHYPTDVAAGIAVGWSWAAFCVATLEAGQRYRSRRVRPRRDS
jgi:undecaprenyl-diphosphatase